MITVKKSEKMRFRIFIILVQAKHALQIKTD